jgi:hypothetical protein
LAVLAGPESAIGSVAANAFRASGLNYPRATVFTVLARKVAQTLAQRSRQRQCWFGLRVARGMSAILSLSDHSGHWPELMLNASVEIDSKATLDLGRPYLIPP